MIHDIVQWIKAKIRGTMDIHRLKRDGIQIGSNFNAQYGVILDPGHCWLIKIGDNVTLAPRVHILAHDASTKKFLGYTKIGRVTIGDNVFIGAGTIVLPNVDIGSNVVVGAGSVVTHNLPDGGVYCGAPCVKVADLDEWVEKQKQRMQISRQYDESWIIGNITEDKKEIMKRDLKKGIGFVV